MKIQCSNTFMNVKRPKLSLKSTEEIVPTFLSMNDLNAKYGLSLKEGQNRMAGKLSFL